MKPLIVLIAAFILSCVVYLIAGKPVDYRFCGNVAMAVMLLFTSVAHFKFNKGMAMMLPGALPYKTSIVYLTGVIEIAAAIGLVVTQVRFATAILLIIFFVLLLPANIYAATKKIDLEKAAFNGNGLSYLWFRIPLQAFFICWVYYFALFS